MNKTSAIERVKSHEEVAMYIAGLKEGNAENQKEAKEALIRTGVLNKNGTPKKVIVSWE